MANPDPEKGKEGTTPDPDIRASSPSSSVSPVEPKQYEEIRTGKDKAVEATGDGVVAVAVASTVSERPGLTRFRSEATSVTSAPSTHWPEQKPWYKQPNPMRWGKIPPVPKEREVCREHNANFFSSLIFEWMSPLMMVSLLADMARSQTNQSSLC